MDPTFEMLKTLADLGGVGIAAALIWYLDRMGKRTAERESEQNKIQSNHLEHDLKERRRLGKVIEQNTKVWVRVAKIMEDFKK